MKDEASILNVLVQGRQDDQQQAPANLHAGPLQLILNEGGLRYIRLGQREVVRRIYASVRDCNWGTVLGAISDLAVRNGPQSFRVHFVSRHRQEDIDYVWCAEITGSARGEIVFQMEGEALSSFRTNRIGICVLHPIQECVGKRYETTSADGETRQGLFPSIVSLASPILDFRALRHEISPGVFAEFQFEGDIFETEDQRNWTDASFKTFSTPLRMPHPWLVRKGDRVFQAVRLRISGCPHSGFLDAKFTPSLTIGETAGRLPDLGSVMASEEAPLTTKESKRLRTLHLSHLRVDLDLDLDSWKPTLRRADVEAVSIRAHLEIAMHNCSPARFVELANVAKALESPIARWLVFPSLEANLLAGKRQLQWSHAPVVGGTDDNFAELMEVPLVTDALDGVCFSVNPQVHSSDDLSVLETPQAQADVVTSAREKFGTVPVFVSPVTLKPRRNPHATAAIRQQGVIPETVDSRQMSLLAACWTLASIKYLAEAGATAATYYETVGWRGMMERSGALARPMGFPSHPGMIYPVFHVFVALAEFAGGTIRRVESSDPLGAVAMAVEKGGERRVLLANLSSSLTIVTIAPFDSATQFHLVHRGNVLDATRDEHHFPTASAVALRPKAGRYRLELPAYAFGYFDLST
jgi:D-apionolactonase